MNPNPSFPIMLVLFAVIIILYSIGGGLYAAHGLEPSAAFDSLYRIGFLCSLIWWLKDDARRHKVKLVYCTGLLVSIAWVILIPYHLFKTRGMKGFVVILVLIGVLIAARVAAVVTYMLFSG